MPISAALGNQDLAIGQSLRFLKLAQEKYKNGKLITEEEFIRYGFSESIIGVFAERIDGGIQAVGAEKHFGWLSRRAEAGRSGGIASAQRMRDDKGRLLSKQTPSKMEQIQASSSPSSSYSKRIKNNTCSSRPLAAVFDFDSVYKKYPKKVGKAGGEKVFRRDIRSAEDYAALNIAVENYTKHLSSEKIEAKFIKHFSTFMASWRDWCDSDAGSVIGVARKKTTLEVILECGGDIGFTNDTSESN